MLQSLRDKSSGLIAKIVLGALIFVFSFFGIESYFTGRNETWVAKVGDREIRPEEFRQRFGEYRQRMTQMMGGQVDGAMFESPETKRQVLNGLIDEQLLLVANDRFGVVVPDERIRDEIQDIPAFQADGKFSQDLYTAALSAQRMSPVMFQERVRNDLAVRTLPGAIAAAGIVTTLDIDTHIKLRDQTRDLRTLTLAKPAAAAAKADDAAIDAYYAAHASEFMTPEQVALEYVEVSASTLNIAATPDESLLRERYEKEKARFVTPEQRLASHILIAAKSADADAQKAALAKAQELAGKARASKDFASIAKQSSEDLGSKAQGGDLGWLEKGVIDAAFEAALFGMKKGDISEPVLSAEGYHIIQLRDLREQKEKTFDEVKTELGKNYLESERERQFSELAGKLTDAGYADPTSLEAAAKAAGVSVQKTPLFSRQGGAAGIAANPAVLKAAFSDSVLVERNNSDAIDLGTDHKVLVRIAEHKRSEARPLDSVREEIRTKLNNDALAKQARETADALLARLQKGETLAHLATELKSSVSEAKATGRSAANIDSRIAAEAFKLPRPAAGKPEYALVALLDNAYALVAVDAVSDGDVSKVDDAGREAVRSQLQNANAMLATKAFVESLRQQTKIVIAEDRLL